MRGMVLCECGATCRAPVVPDWAHSRAGCITGYGPSEGPRFLGSSVLLHSCRAAVAITGRRAQSSPRSTAFSILGASQRRGMHEGREYHERGRTSILDGG